MKTVGLVFLLVVGLAGVYWMTRGIVDNDTRLKIDVASGPDGVRFRFSYCDGQRRTPELHLVEVFPTQRDRKECFMVVERGGSQPLPEWRLGAPTSGFLMQRCDALPPGEYRVTVSGAGQFGTATFRLAADGSAAATSPPCQ